MFGNNMFSNMVTGGIVPGFLMGQQNESPGYQGPTPGSYLEQIPDILKKYMGQYQGMMEDPTGIMSKFGSKFQASPGYQYQLGQGQQAIGQAAAAGGMAGSPMQQQQSAQMAEGLANQDYYNFLNKALGLYGTGAQGYGQLGEDLSRNLMSQASLANMQEEQAQREREFQQAQGAQQGADWTSLIAKLLPSMLAM